MAALCKHVATEFGILSRYVLTRVFINSLRPQAVHCIYTQEGLGITGYERTREKVFSQFENIRENFISKMENSSGESSTAMIFTEDLLNMTYLVDNDPHNMNLMIKLIKKYNNQDTNLGSKNFIFGPIVMRTFYYLDEPEAAFAAFTDPGIDGFFDQFTSFQILMDLLFNHQMYNRVLEVFEKIRAKQLRGVKNPKYCVTIALASLYKLNNPESLQQATQLCSEMQNAGDVIIRRAANFVAALALKQNAPHITLEILVLLRSKEHVTVRNLRIWAYADLDRPKDAFNLLRNLLETNKIYGKMKVAKESIDKLTEAVERSGDKDIKLEYEQLKMHLIAGDLISEQAIDELLCAQMEHRHTVKDEDQDGQFKASSFNRKVGRVPQR